ncbi:hypothetical protein KAR91_42485, partial [Candidatus Pacearchaeota archaeon]|nr:hypothetical protein [Candidatus Pacearchaeota archaeon]
LVVVCRDRAPVSQEDVGLIPTRRMVRGGATFRLTPSMYVPFLALIEPGSSSRAYPLTASRIRLSISFASTYSIRHSRPESK